MRRANWSRSARLLVAAIGVMLLVAGAYLLRGRLSQRSQPPLTLSIDEIVRGGRHLLFSKMGSPSEIYRRRFDALDPSSLGIDEPVFQAARHKARPDSQVEVLVWKWPPSMRHQATVNAVFDVDTGEFLAIGALQIISDRQLVWILH